MKPARLGRPWGRTLLCLVKAVEEPEQLTGGIALETASNLRQRPAFGGATDNVVAGGLVVSAASEDDAVEGRVELTVTPAVEAMTDGLARGGGDRADAGQGGKGGLARHSPGVRPGEQNLGPGQRAKTRLLTQARSHLLDQDCDLALIAVGVGAELANHLGELAHGGQAGTVLGTQTRTAATGQTLTDQPLGAMGTKIQEARAQVLGGGDHQLHEVVSQPGSVADQLLASGEQDAQLLAFSTPSRRIEALHGQGVATGTDGIDLIRLAPLARWPLGSVDLGHGLAMGQQMLSQRSPVRASALNRPKQWSGQPRAKLDQFAMAPGVGADLEQLEATAARIQSGCGQGQLVSVDTDDVDELLCQDGHGYLLQGDQRCWSGAPPGGDPVRGHAIGRTSSLLSQRVAQADTSGGPGGHVLSHGMQAQPWRAQGHARLPLA